MLGQLLYPDEMPKKLVILGVEASDVDSFNAGLSPKVEQSIPDIIGTIKEELGNYVSPLHINSHEPDYFPRYPSFRKMVQKKKNGGG